MRALDMAVLEEAQDIAAGLHTFEPADIAALAQLEHSYTGWVAGKPVCCAGLTPRGPDCAEVWAFLSKDVKPHMLWVVRAMGRFLTLYAPARVEAAVDVDYLPGHRLVRALGFQPEKVLPAHCIDGRDHMLYVRHK